MPEPGFISLPLWQLPVLVLLPVAVLVALGIGMRRFVRRRSAPGEERDWSVPHLAAMAGTSPLHRWDVRCKLVTILVYSFMVVSLGRLTSALAAVAVSLLVLVIARASLAKVLMRLLAISGFVGMFFVVMPLTAPVHSGDTVVIFGGLEWLGFNLRGLQLAATIGAKAVAITLLMEPLLSTAPLPVTLHGLSRLGAPEIIGQMVLLSYRYLHVFRHEALRMSSGMQVRGFRKRTDLQTLRAVANFLGMLFVRSFERTERVFDAMRARGYRGRFPEPETTSMAAKDLVLAAVWLVAGAALVACDRICG
ncbi:MAG: cobalt ECF transporter T component CbiQ [Desulfobacteraceae bacterium]